MIDFLNVDKWSLGYESVRSGSRPMLFHMFYKKVEYANIENIPDDRPVIFALNHQNALIDALVVTQMRKKYQIVFLARADIFKKDRVAKILRWMKIMPVFRIRDGASNLGKNDAIFERTADILKDGNKLGMMPEGNHGDKKRLRKLNKGFCRIAFKAQEKFKDQPGIVIVPVGLDFSHYQNMRSRALVKFGKPIEMANYWMAYEENQPVAFNTLVNDYREELLKHIIHIETDEHYENYISLCTMFGTELCEQKGIKPSLHVNQLAVQQKMVQSLDALAVDDPVAFKKIQDDVDTYRNLTKKTGLTDKLVAKPKSNILRLFAENIMQLITLPLYLIGLINGAISFFIPKAITNKKVKDPQFKSTFRYVLSLILFIVFNILIMVPLVLIFIPLWWMKVAYLIAMPITMIFAFNYYVWAANLLKRWKICFLKVSGNKQYKELVNLRTSIKERLLKLS